MTELTRIRTVFTGVAGTPWYSNHYFEGGGGLASAYGASVGNFWDALGSIMHTSAAWEVETDAAIVESTTGLIVDIDSWAGESGAGDVVTEPLPWANQAVINWHTGVFLQGRELRGKTFVPALTQAVNNSGVLQGVAVTDILAAADGLIADSNSGFCVFSRTHFAESIVESAGVPTKIAVLRSRRD